jgi:integrase
MRFVFSKETGGHRVYYSNIWDPARRCKIKKKLGTNLREAEELAEKLHAQVVARNLGVRPKLAAPALDEFVPRFLAENYEGKVTLREATRSITRFRQFAGNIPLTAVTKGLLHDFITHRRKDYVPGPFRGKSKTSTNTQTWTPKKKIKNGTVNRDIQTIKRLLSFAFQREILDWNPLARFPTLSTKDSVRRPMLSPEQIQHLLDAASKSKNWRFLLAVMLALYTARRRSDIFKRRATDYSRTQGLLFLGKTKKGEDEWIQLAGAARRALDVLFDKAVGGWLFPNATGTGPVEDMDTAFKVAKRRAGIAADFRWHDLRHVGISYMVMSGVDFNTVASLAGHTTATMVEKTYGHLSRKHKEATSVIFGGYMDRITGRGPERGEITTLDSTPAISTQVADFISSEAAKGLIVLRIPTEEASSATPSEKK